MGCRQRAARLRRRASSYRASPDERTPQELCHSFDSVPSDAGVPLEEISRLVGHSGTTVTEMVYRHQLKPLIQTGTTVMDSAVREQAIVSALRQAQGTLPGLITNPTAV